MSKTGSGLGKPLKGISNLSASLSSSLEDSIISQISNGSIELTNIQITGGTINSTVVGNDIPGPVYATIIQSGTPDGNGYNVIFYGDTLGEYFEWNASLGLINIQGDLSVSQVTDLGNIRISGNTITTTNSNGDIIIDPNGTGGLVITGDLIQNTSQGNIQFQSGDGSFSTTVSDEINLTSVTGGLTSTTSQEQTFTSNNGDIILESGASKTTYDITNISTGLSPTITTSSAHGLEVGDSIFITGSNSVPSVNGDQTVTVVVDDNEFQITLTAPVTGIGNTGTFQKNTDIYLTANGNINIPYDVKLTFGSDSNYIIDTSSPLDDMTIASNADINISPIGDINIPDNVGLTFGSDLRKIESDGTDLILSGDSGVNILSASTTISGNTTIDGTVTTVNSTSISLADPVVTIGTTADDSKDRGVEFGYFNSGSKLGWFGYDDTDEYFTYYLDATNTGEVLSGTLGNAKFATGSFTNLQVSGGSISAPSIDTCNINCNGLMTLTGSLGIKLNAPSGQNVIIPQGTFLKFGETGTPSTVIYKEPTGTGDDLIIQSQNHLFLTPGSNVYDVILPTGSGVVFNGEGGSQKIESISSTELAVYSSSFLNLIQTSGGVRLTEGLPLHFNNDETTKITGDVSGNMIVNSGNSINLVPSSGQVTLPANKQIQLGSASNYIGSSGGNVLLNTSGSLASTSIGDTSITSSTGDIYLTNTSSSKNVIMSANRKLLFGSSGSQYIGSDGVSNVIINSSSEINSSSVGSQNLTSTGSSINLSPSTFVNIPYTKPLQFGSASESITGTSGNLLLTAADSTLSGNLTVNGTSTVINSINVSFDDPILTIGGDTVPVSDDNKDRGIEFRYYDTSDKLGYFGYDDTDGYFMYIPNATNVGEVISGALGNAKFNIGSFNEINMNGGNVTNVNTLSSNGNLTIDPGNSSDVIFNVDSGANITIPPNVDLLFDGEDAKFYSDGTDLHVDVTSPGKFLIDTDAVVNGDLTITGNVNIVGGSSTNFTVERLTVPALSSGSPNSTSNISFITITGTGVATGTMPAGITDGFVKHISFPSIASGCSYELTFPSGRLVDAVSGSTVGKKMIFDCSGQSVQMIWDNVEGVFIITQGGAELVTL